MKIQQYGLLALIITFFMYPSQARVQQEKMDVDKSQVTQWNQFANQLFKLHTVQLQKYQTQSSKSSGGYYRLEHFFTEERFYDKASGRLLSRIQRETKNPDNIHLIEVFVHDAQGNIVIDYLSAYLPQSRNAPIQTLINLHHQDKDLKAYRQFDASGDKIYEECRGSFYGEAFFISIDEDQQHRGSTSTIDTLNDERYLSCFGDLAVVAGIYQDPIKASHLIASEQNIFSQQATKSTGTSTIASNIENKIKTGIEHFNNHEFSQAIKELSEVLKANPDHDQALFWRGMAHGRNRQHTEGINDLSAYINKNPNDSRAYTKRGVRYIWAGKLDLAKNDLTKAIKLDATNSEAHDDLGVLMAQKKQYSKALSHFQQALKYDPTYQKAWHNMAMVYYMNNKPELALNNVNKSLALKPNRDSMLLKSLIAEAQGQDGLANTLKIAADRLPTNNWSESFTIQ